MKKSLSILSACVVLAVAPVAAQAALVTITYTGGASGAVHGTTYSIDGSGTVSESSANFSVSQDVALPTATYGSSFLLNNGAYKNTNTTTGAQITAGTFDNNGLGNLGVLNDPDGNNIGNDGNVEGVAYRLNLAALAGGAQIKVQIMQIGVAFLGSGETARVIDRIDGGSVSGTALFGGSLDVSALDLSTTADVAFVDIATIIANNTSTHFMLRNVVLEFSLIPAPEPSSFMLATLGLVGLGFSRRRRKRS